MNAASQEGLDEKNISEAIDIDAEEIRRILRGQGVSDLTIWQVIKNHLMMD